MIGSVPYAIQGRPIPFDASDIVPLNFKVSTAGNYTIAIDHVDGLFTGSGQTIYLKDNLTTTVHNLSTGAYSFASAAGAFASRFEIIYQNTLLVDIPTFNENQVVIYKNEDNEFVINTGSVTMDSVKIFDISGRLLQETKDINASQTIISAGLSNQILLVQIISDAGILINKKVIR